MHLFNSLTLISSWFCLVNCYDFFDIERQHDSFLHQIYLYTIKSFFQFLCWLFFILFFYYKKSQIGSEKKNKMSKHRYNTQMKCSPTNTRNLSYCFNNLYQTLIALVSSFMAIRCMTVLIYMY